MNANYLKALSFITMGFLKMMNSTILNSITRKIQSFQMPKIIIFPNINGTLETSNMKTT